MRRNARQNRTETRSIQRSVQILLTVCGIVFLLAGMVLAVSGASVSSAIGSVSDRIDDARQPTDGGGDTADSDSTGDSGVTDTDGASATTNETGETDSTNSTGSQTDGTDSTDSDGSNETTTDESHVLTAVVESQNGDVIDNATVTVDPGSASNISKSVDGNGEAEFALADGEYAVTANADGYNPAETTVPINGADETITLSLEQQTQADSGSDDSGGTHTLAVTVTDENGTAVENATVEVTEDDIFFDSGETKEVGDDGEATFELEDGEYTVTAADGNTVAERAVTIDGGDESITLTLESTDG